MRVFNWIGLGLTTKALAYEPFDRRLIRSRAHKTRNQAGHSVRHSNRHQKYVPARVADIQNDEADEEEYVWSKERFNLEEIRYMTFLTKNYFQTTIKCAIDNVDVICTCETEIVVPEYIPPPKPIVYIVAIVNDDGIGTLYTHVRDFYKEMQRLNGDKVEYRLVHRSNGKALLNGGAKATGSGSFKCAETKYGFSVTPIPDGADFHDFFHNNVPEGAIGICSGNAYNAMYRNGVKHQNFRRIAYIM